MEKSQQIPTLVQKICLETFNRKKKSRKERNKNVLDMHSPKGGGGEKKMGNFIKAKGQFSP